ncbi:hypothetical protein BGZ58_003958 [Dissophora ornata]|nr:hypothetical protein BGZ58_003958 [Dissophora ornata]
MASTPTSAVSEVRDIVSLDAAAPPLAASPLPKHNRDLAETDRENDDDARVPSLPSYKPLPAPIETVAARRSYWDDAFYSTTPTPKPPPRLAPMPKSPPSGSIARSPPPPLVISTQRESNTVQTPAGAGGDRHELSDPKAKSVFPPARHTHGRSHSHGQAHSHHGNNIFAHSSDYRPTVNDMGGSPSLGSLSTMGTEDGLGADFNLDHVPNGSTARSYSNMILSNASPAAVRSSFPLQLNPGARHAQSLLQPQPQLHRHHPPHNPLLTPSSSQSNLFSNLPSPLTRTNLSTANIFRDPPAPAHSGLSNWVSSQATDKPVDNDISESSILQQDTPVANTTNSVEDVAAPNNVGSGPRTSSQRIVYPGLKNTVGRYKLLRNIGHGSFSEVKMAIDSDTKEHVAIKVMSKAMIQSSDRLGTSVRRESDLLKHPNIIGFREVVETSLQTCIVLDYVSGGELFEFVAAKRAVASEQDMQYIFAQIVDAVDYLHQHNIVHRDLKLENVILEPRTGAPLRPQVKLTDFGLAKVIEEDAPLLTTRCGSEDYAAPEIILGQPYDGREADIWSLGVVLYALLVGFLPFNKHPGMDRKSFLSMIVNAEFGFPGEKVSFKRASLLDLRQRSLSTASTASNASTAASIVATGASTPVSMGTAAATITTTMEAGVDHHAPAPMATVPPTTTSDTHLVAEEAPVSTMIVPKKRGVDSVSCEAKELVRWLLHTQGSKRPTARELRDHPWIVAGRQLEANPN